MRTRPLPSWLGMVCAGLAAACALDTDKIHVPAASVDTDLLVDSDAPHTDPPVDTDRPADTGTPADTDPHTDTDPPAPLPDGCTSVAPACVTGTCRLDVHDPTGVPVSITVDRPLATGWPEDTLVWLRLRDATQGVTVEGEFGPNPTGVAPIPPGTYEVVEGYLVGSLGQNLVDHRAFDPVTIAAAGEVQVRLRTSLHTGRVTVDGLPPAAGTPVMPVPTWQRQCDPDCRGWSGIILGEHVTDADGGFAITLPRDEHDLALWDVGVGSGPLVFANTTSLASEPDVDVHLARVSGSFQVDGNRDSHSRWRLRFESRTHGRTRWVAAASSYTLGDVQPYAIDVVAGDRYDIVFHSEPVAAGATFRRVVLAQDVRITDDTTLDLHAALGHLVGTVGLATVPVPSTVRQYVGVLVASAHTPAWRDDVYYSLSTVSGALDVWLPQATYEGWLHDRAYNSPEGTGHVPVQSLALGPTSRLDAFVPGPLDVDVELTYVGAWENEAVGLVALSHRATGNLYREVPGVPVQVPPGTYDVYASWTWPRLVETLYQSPAWTPIATDQVVSDDHTWTTQRTPRALTGSYLSQPAPDAVELSFRPVTTPVLGRQFPDWGETLPAGHHTRSVAGARFRADLLPDVYDVYVVADYGTVSVQRDAPLVHCAQVPEPATPPQP